MYCSVFGGCLQLLIFVRKNPTEQSGWNSQPDKENPAFFDLTAVRILSDQILIFDLSETTILENYSHSPFRLI